ncbi:MAG: D-alanyl-D-alanine carboxypeptidase family protein [Promicromonosporaceae bacterium]|nr:D-alanyl-D-alanine carboxypeptidase family protein [Promicromonosporaceae bacterium]
MWDVSEITNVAGAWCVSPEPLRRPSWRPLTLLGVVALGFGVLTAAAAVGLPLSASPPPTEPIMVETVAAIPEPPARVMVIAAPVTEEEVNPPATVTEVLALVADAEQVAAETNQPVTAEMEEAAALLSALVAEYLYLFPEADLRGYHPTWLTQPEAPTSAGEFDAVIATVQLAYENLLELSTVLYPAQEVGDPPVVDVDEVREVEAHPEAVTFAEVVVAALRLADLLDPTGEYLLHIEIPVLASETADYEPWLTLATARRQAVEHHGGSLNDFTNGRIPVDALCPLPFAPGHRLRCDGAKMLSALNEAYHARFGSDLPITDSYRDFDAQIEAVLQKPELAATPGHSMHGWGLAIDFAAPIASGASAEYYWLRLNAPRFGWDNPAWARLTGSKPEPWHFEFFAGGAPPTNAVPAADLALYQAALLMAEEPAPPEEESWPQQDQPPEAQEPPSPEQTDSLPPEQVEPSSSEQVDPLPETLNDAPVQPEFALDEPELEIPGLSGEENSAAG